MIVVLSPLQKLFRFLSVGIKCIKSSLATQSSIAFTGKWALNVNQIHPRKFAAQPMHQLGTDEYYYILNLILEHEY